MRILSVAAALLLGLSHTVQATTIDEAVSKIDRLVHQHTEDGKFSGTVLIAKGDEVLYETATGLASQRFDVPNTLETRFNMGSGTKMFTAIATLQLVQAGELQLTDTLDKYADESWLPREISSKIQIQHLLTHASGLGSYFTDEFFEASRYKYKAIEDYKPLVVVDKLEFEPGTDYRYSNNGMLLLGVVIQSVSGKSYYDYISDHIYAPAGMQNSGCFPTDMPFKNVAIGYHATDKSPVGYASNVVYKPLRGGPAGGCFSNVHDLQRFANALTSHKLLDKQFTDMLFTPKAEFHQEPYGYGFKVAGTPDDRIVGHSGGFYGVSANLDIYLDRGLMVAVLSNLSSAAHILRPKIREILATVD
ncbi:MULTISPECIES: serine hydrolase domain-containing protein [Kordiimonas]|jgi:CubicO group peptidase (beta-lactamase class C family)|uniref:serine hydrolase domain-containing protein n=1 Tax=Kordiimonas TaxID=288021 RepID=UPI00257A6FA0|nr:serine hydrolase domain-containing protein [Kordiimonas sp. UBA4487]